MVIETTCNMIQTRFGKSYCTGLLWGNRLGSRNSTHGRVSREYQNEKVEIAFNELSVATPAYIHYIDSESK